ncbi:MAG TPA: fimbria/pilus outer membrane usher protein [Ramlibacter sp.]|nr:fimbria/pilus outer membrane usher protein [Ramlibacter sp.]
MLAAACIGALPAAWSAPHAGTQLARRDTRQPETLLVELQVNGEPVPGIFRVDRLADGRLVVPDAAWQAARLRPAGESISQSGGEPGHALEAVPGLSYRVDRGHLMLFVTAPAAAFETSSLRMTGGAVVPTDAAVPGAYLNYDIHATRADRAATYTGLFEGVFFNRWGSFSAAAAVTAEGNSRRAVRTETFHRRDFPAAMESLVVGDTIGSDGTWSRPVRYGGIRYARDFSLAPGFVTTPMPTIGGSAALPSTVDLLVNNRKQSTTSVPTGPFELTNVPVVNGAGDINLVVRDLRGMETVVSQSYYASPSLLGPGLSDFSFEAGALREHFGTESNDYGPVFAAGGYRYGVSPALTAGGRLELQRTRQAAGVNATALLGTYAVVQGAVAASRTTEADPTGAASGTRWLARFERVTPGGGVSVQAEHFSAGFRPLAAAANEARPRDRLQAGAGMPLGRGVDVGASFIRQTTWEGDTYALLAMNVGVKLTAHVYLSAYAGTQFGTSPGWSAGASLVVPLDAQVSMSGSTRRNFDGGIATQTQATRSAPQGPGWGWTVGASDVPGQLAQARATLNTNAAQFTGEINAGRNNNAVRLGINGSLGWMGGLAFASRRIGDGAFAVVRVGDLEDVAVSRSNQVAATTNGKGLALVTGLLPYQRNQLSIDPEALPMNVDVAGVRETAVPGARSGVMVSFPVKRSRNVLVTLQQADGTPVPAGARVALLPGGREFVVARRGEVYLTDIASQGSIAVRWKSGGCELPLKLDAAAPAEARIGPLTCGSVTP